MSRSLPAGKRDSLAGIALRLTRRSFRELLHVTMFRYVVAAARYLFYAVLLRRIRTFSSTSTAIATNTIGHNLRGMVDLAVIRSLSLIRPLCAIDRVAQESDTLRVLCVGPRTEGELLNLVAHGFSARNVRGLDLITYSPWVDLGDMHAMPYPARSWDVVILGWVLSYSNDRPTVAREVLRIARHGTLVAIGVEHAPLGNRETEAELGYLPGAEERIRNTEQILRWFEPHVGTIYFRHDVSTDRSDRKGAICVVFSIEKTDPPVE